MFENEDHNNFKDIESLKAAFQKLMKGQSHRALHEDDFEALIDYFEVEGDQQNWKLACELSTDIYPFSSALLLRKAEWYLEQKQVSLALAIVQKVQTTSPGDLDCLLLHADILIQADKAQQAIVLLNSELVKFDKAEKVHILMELSDIYDELTEFEKVYDTLKKVLNLDPKVEDALVRMCFWADVTKQQKDCIDFHIAILDDNPLYASAWYNLGLLYQSIKNYVEAIEAYENCMSIDSQFDYALRNLGECYVQQEEFDKAIAVFEEHMQIAKAEDVILETLAFCWEHKKQFAKARQYYRKASLMNPEDDTVFFKIGETYVKERQWDKAIKSFSVALHLEKEKVNYSLALGDCLMQIEAEDEAVVCYLNAVKLKPTKKIIWLALCRALYATDYLEECIRQLQLAEEHCGHKIEFEYYCAGILLALGKTKESIPYIENALARDVRKANCLNDLDPEILRHPIFADLYARYKK
jgi:tetratricopeptide (TPR) repeat protein